MRQARTLKAANGAARAARILGVSESTLRRWAGGEFQTVKKSTVKLARAATKARREAREYARAHGAAPVTGARVRIVPKAKRVIRRDWSLLGRPVPGKPGKKYTRKTLPEVRAETVAHDVRGFAADDVALVLQALRDRGGKFRVVFQTPKGDKRYPSRRGSTAPLDPEDMDDDELGEWLSGALQGGVYKPLFVMEMD